MEKTTLKLFVKLLSGGVNSDLAKENFYTYDEVNKKFSFNKYLARITYQDFKMIINFCEENNLRFYYTEGTIHITKK